MSWPGPTRPSAARRTSASAESDGRGQPGLTVTRRTAGLSLAAMALLGFDPPAFADDAQVTKSPGLAILAKPALPPGFPYFPYVNPNACSGGTCANPNSGG